MLREHSPAEGKVDRKAWQYNEEEIHLPSATRSWVLDALIIKLKT